ncbi:unnamed protein product [Prorocentrum cordatum]|uniref:Uncharacterized protein n=1 Tax=Prorocentrum cordatum TaxID=2364126 RepID=A0ABN9VTB8_9DINO|nr:unnamed protein product [Polarella glacialis]
MARSPRGGGCGRRCKAYWMCSCGGWNWDWRTSCLCCGHAAPPWAMGALSAKARPKADKDGWVDQPRGAAEPPDGVDGCSTDAVVRQLEAKRAELVKAQKAAAEQKTSSLPRATRLHREANAISKGEKRLRAARQVLVQKQEARDLVEAQLQKAQEELAELDAQVEEASRALQALRRQRAAEWTGANQAPGLLMQLEKLPEAWSSSNFEVAWAAIRAQMEAVRAQLEGAPAAPKRAPWAESCPMEETSSDDGELADGGDPWQPQPAAERGQAERHGEALGEWPTVAQACKRELSERCRQGQRVPSKASAAGLRLHESGAEGVGSDLVGRRGMGVLGKPRGQESAARPSWDFILLGAEENAAGAIEFGTSEWGDRSDQAGVHGDPEATAVLQRRLASSLKRDGGKSSASCRRWAKQAVQKGDRLARRFAKAVPPLPVVDPGSTLPPLNPEMLQAVRKRRSLAASLGADQLHPRQLLLPPSALRLRGLALSEAREEQPMALEAAAGLRRASPVYDGERTQWGGDLRLVPERCMAMDTQEIAACTKRGAYKVLGGRAGGKSRLEVQCPGPSYLTNKSGRNQRSLRGRGLRPGRPRADQRRVRAEGIPALRSQGPVPGHAQERYLEWIGIEAEPAGGATAAASSSGSGPAAAAAQGAQAAAASLPQQRPGLSADAAGVAAEEELAAAGAPPIGGLVSRRVRRRLARRGSEHLEFCLEEFGSEAGPTGGASAAASSSGGSPAAPAAAPAAEAAEVAAVSSAAGGR